MDKLGIESPTYAHFFPTGPHISTQQAQSERQMLLQPWKMNNSHTQITTTNNVDFQIEARVVYTYVIQNESGSYNRWNPDRSSWNSTNLSQSSTRSKSRAPLLTTQSSHVPKSRCQQMKPGTRDPTQFYRVNTPHFYSHIKHNTNSLTPNLKHFLRLKMSVFQTHARIWALMYSPKWGQPP